MDIRTYGETYSVNAYVYVQLVAAKIFHIYGISKLYVNLVKYLRHNLLGYRKILGYMTNLKSERVERD